MTTPIIVDQTSVAWIQSRSYFDLVEHFALAGPWNKLHMGPMGKVFSDAMNEKRAALTPEQIADAETRALAGTKYDGPKH